MTRRFPVADRSAHASRMPGPVVRTIVALLAAFVLTSPAPRAQAPSASELAARVQARYDTIRDFSADFVQTQTNPLLPKPVVERGEVKIKKPGRMRWVYTTGDRNQLVSDGTTIYAYFPRDRYVSPSPMPKGDEATTGLLFLAGRGSLTRDFTAALSDGQRDGEWRIDLTPRNGNAEFEQLTLEVDRNSLAFRGLVIIDAQGGTSAFRFTNLRENRSLADSEFAFTVPRGVEVR